MKKKKHFVQWNISEVMYFVLLLYEILQAWMYGYECIFVRVPEDTSSLIRVLLIWKHTVHRNIKPCLYLLEGISKSTHFKCLVDRAFVTATVTQVIFGENSLFIRQMIFTHE